MTEEITLLMPNILKPALDLPLGCKVTMVIDKEKEPDVVRQLIKNGWIVDE